MNNISLIRLNKYIGEKAFCSRREADKFIENGNVLLNGKKAKLGDLVKPGDKVVLNGKLLEQVEEKKFILIALNKPEGITSTTESSVKGNIIEFVNHSDRIFPIGRLDKDSQGLILLTNNGDIVNKILRAGNKHEKEYIVTVNKLITDSFIEGMSKGVNILGETTKKCVVKKESHFVFRIILTQGLNRQIRRMCEYFNYEVLKLERIRIMNITLKGMPIGDWRQLNDNEISTLLKSIENSSSEPIPAKIGSKPQTNTYPKSKTAGKPHSRNRNEKRNENKSEMKNKNSKVFTRKRSK